MKEWGIGPDARGRRGRHPSTTDWMGVCRKTGFLQRMGSVLLFSHLILTLHHARHIHICGQPDLMADKHRSGG